MSFYWYITYEGKNIMTIESLVNQVHKIAQGVVEERNIMKNEKKKQGNVLQNIGM